MLQHKQVFILPHIEMLYNKHFLSACKTVTKWTIYKDYLKICLCLWKGHISSDDITAWCFRRNFWNSYSAVTCYFKSSSSYKPLKNIQITSSVDVNNTFLERRFTGFCILLNWKEAFVGSIVYSFMKRLLKICRFPNCELWQIILIFSETHLLIEGNR